MRKKVVNGKSLVKKWSVFALSAVVCVLPAGCGDTADTDTAKSAETQSQEEETQVVWEESIPVEGEVSIFYYTFADTYVASVRAALDQAFDEAGVTFADYDGENSQETQNKQIKDAIAAGCSALVVNLVDSGSERATQKIVNMASDADLPLVFFNRSVDEETVETYENCVFVGTNYEAAGHMQGELIGEYLTNHYDEVDLNGDGTISYLMLKGDENNEEAIARTQYGQEDADVVLTAAGYPALVFYDEDNNDKYLLDETGSWSAEQGEALTKQALSEYTQENGNMIELIIANNDEMALGAINALNAAGYNNLEKEDSVFIPVFGVDATAAAREAIAEGTMTGTIKQDADGMAEAIAQIVNNLTTGAAKFNECDKNDVVGNWRINIPYAPYTG